MPAAVRRALSRGVALAAPRTNRAGSALLGGYLSRGSLNFVYERGGPGVGGVVTRLLSDVKPTEPFLWRAGFAGQDLRVPVLPALVERAALEMAARPAASSRLRVVSAQHRSRGAVRCGSQRRDAHLSVRRVRVEERRLRASALLRRISPLRVPDEWLFGGRGRARGPGRATRGVGPVLRLAEQLVQQPEQRAGREARTRRDVPCPRLDDRRVLRGARRGTHMSQDRRGGRRASGHAGCARDAGSSAARPLRRGPDHRKRASAGSGRCSMPWTTGSS
jgi:hypothetical protein